MSKLLAGAYAVRIIETHVRDIAAAAYPHPPQAIDPYYDYWVAHLQSIKEILDGKFH